MTESLSTPWKEKLRKVIGAPNDSLIPSFTLVLLLLKFGVDQMPGFGSPEIGAIFSFLCCLALLHRPLQTNRHFWLVLVGVQAIFLLLYWEKHDNHNYLIVYWSLAISLGLFFEGEERIKAWILSASTLIAATMILAAFQKCRADGYLDGSFFLYKILTSQRFEFLGLITDFDSVRVVKENAIILDGIKSNTQPENLVGATPALEQIALFVTWWGLSLEAITGLLFVCPERFRFSHWKHPFLLVFCATVYTLLPIRAFGAVLLLMGFVQTKPHQFYLRLGYLVALVYIYFFSSVVIKAVL